MLLATFTEKGNNYIASILKDNSSFPDPLARKHHIHYLHIAADCFHFEARFQIKIAQFQSMN